MSLSGLKGTLQTIWPFTPPAQSDLERRALEKTFRKHFSAYFESFDMHRDGQGRAYLLAVRNHPHAMQSVALRVQPDALAICFSDFSSARNWNDLAAFRIAATSRENIFCDDPSHVIRLMEERSYGPIALPPPAGIIQRPL